MRKYSVMFAAMLLMLGAATSAGAMTMTAPAGLRAAIQETKTTETVYWGWGWRRPYWGVGWGWRRPYWGYRRVYVVPRYYYAPAYYYPRPRFYARPIFWGGPRFYGRRFYRW
jgi:hypothetical protein